MKIILTKLTLILLSVSLISSVVTLVNPKYVLADAKTDACTGVALTGGTCDPVAASAGVNSVISVAVNIFSWIVGVAAVIMVIVGGFKYVTSTGDSNSVNSAKNTILYALVGLAVVALAQIIVRFVLGRVQK